MFSSDEFLDAFSKDKRYFIPLPFLWKVTIDGVTAEAINQSVSKANEKWLATDIPNNYVKHNNILVAQECTLPNELYTLGATTINNAGAFLPGYTVNERANFRDRELAINFLETGKDIEHEFFRPWLIAIAIDGLIGSKLKAQITVNQYAQNGEFRKGFKFVDAFPTASEGYTLKYSVDSQFLVKTVSFSYRNYEKIT